MGEVQGQGYIAQALGVADVLAVAYFHAMGYHPDDPEWEGRDRFLLVDRSLRNRSYAALIEAGIIPEDELETTARMTAGCRCRAWPAYTPGMEISRRFARPGPGDCGRHALGLKRKKSDAFVYCLFSDGECGEGAVWEGGHPAPATGSWTT